MVCGLFLIFADMTLQQLLIKYWCHQTFRPLQEDIINSVMQGNDTLALMPTGGGKSICYQIPALAQEGICIVISPLIALMKDQVEKLKKKDIKAIAIYSGMHKSEIDIAFDKCVYGDVKLLYISPERLSSDMAIARIRKMKVSLLAVDEAHCISHWGYDFRPPYLKIAEIREFLPDVPVLALTATATAEVIIDIQKKLLFKKENVFSVSFERKNLIYSVTYGGDKSDRLLKFVKKTDGQGIIYVRSRIRSAEISDFLIKNNISSTYYHAGLENKLRMSRQSEWMKGKTRIIVCTSAFGMGIDKPDVSFVIHYDPVETIEEYFQQAGRAGRDGNKASALLLYSEADKYELLKNFNIKFPGMEKIKSVYKALGNYYQLATGSGMDESFDFDIKDFCNNYKLEVLLAFNCIKFLERAGYIIHTERFTAPSRLHIKMNKEELYRFQVENIKYDNFIKTLLRSYGGTFTDFQIIYENDIAYRVKIPQENVVKILEHLRKLNVLDYIPQKSKPQIIFCKPRLDTEHIHISKEDYDDRRQVAEKKLEAFIDYAESNHKCRSQMMLAYFGEINSKRCGFCDVCLKRNILDLNELEFDLIADKLKPILLKQPLSLDEIIALFENIDDSKILKVISWLRENGKLHLNTDNKFEWKK